MFNIGDRKKFSLKNLFIVEIGACNADSDKYKVYGYQKYIIARKRDELYYTYFEDVLTNTEYCYFFRNENKVGICVNNP